MTEKAIHILVVDDEAQIREVLKEYLEGLGNSVISVASAEEAIAIKELSTIDVALIDIHLHGMINGHDLVKEVKRIAPDVVLILMSGKSNVDDLISAFEGDVFSFLKKPFHSLREVNLLVEKAAESKRLVVENKQYVAALETSNIELEQKVAHRTRELERAREVVSHLFSVSSQMGRIEPLDSLLSFVCRSIVESGAFRRAAILLADEKFIVRNIGRWPQTDNGETWEQHLLDMRGSPLRPFDFHVHDEKMGSAWISNPDNILNKTDLTESNQWSATKRVSIPLTRSDGTVFGFLSTDSPGDDQRPTEEIIQYLDMLLHHGSLQIESQILRNELQKRADELESRVVERTTELRLSQEKFSRLVNLTTDIVYITDSEGRIVYLNEAFTRTLGYVRENYIGRDVKRVFEEIATDDPVNLQEIETLTSLSFENALCQIEVLTRSGDKRNLEINRSLIRQGGAISGSQGIARDVSEYRALLQRLISSERLAATGKLAAGIAHEINNPLQAMSSHLSTALERLREKKDPTESLAILRDSIDRIRVIVRGLLDLHRTPAAARVEVDICNIIEKVLALLQKQLQEASVNAALDLHKDIHKILGSPAELQQVFLNLILNAIEAMPEGGILRVSTSEMDRHVEVRIEDTGVGIKKEYLDKLFEPFFSFRSRGGGTGLGLYVSRNIVEMHGGSIGVESTEGSGSLFTLRFPIP